MLSDQLAKKVKITKWEDGEIKAYGTPCFAAWEPYERELDSLDYYTKWHPNLAKNWLEKQDKITSQGSNPYKEKIAKRLSSQNRNTKDATIDSTKTETVLKDTTIKNTAIGTIEKDSIAKSIVI